ncbi:MAG: DUF3567 domain-containing protein [Burkholderiaceae bacterium]|nr:DUF3567 domain-containing protein [Burkholderiaceae bacterium]
MHMIYDSPSYCVVEFRDPEGLVGGFEIMDKTSRREVFLGGALARRFREDVDALVSTEPTIDEIDAFLAGFGPFMVQPMSVH